MLRSVPRLPFQCSYSFLPGKLRPSSRTERLGALHMSIQQLLYGVEYRGCNHSLMFRPQGLLAALAVPTAESLSTSGQLRLLLPSRTCIVTFASIGYANHLNRAIGGKRTYTSLVLGFASYPQSPSTKGQMSKSQSPKRTSGTPTRQRCRRRS